MKNNFKFFLILVAIVCAALVCISCGNDPAETTADPSGNTTAETTVATTTAATTEPLPTEGVIEVKWNYGYVGSASHASSPNKIVENGSMYSYSDVITIPRKGTKITFTDDNTNANGDANFASAAAYVISSWKQVDGQWVIDLDWANIAGSGKSASDIATVKTTSVIYNYVTSKDNENIRICFRSGQSETFTPAAYPEVSYVVTEELGTHMQTVGGLDSWAEESKKDAYFDVLKGLTINALGDSYFAGNGLDARLVWPALLAKKYDMTLENYGANGSAICSFDPGRNPMVNRYQTMKDNNPDIVLLEGGRNDFNVKAPLGTNTDTDPSKSFKGGVNFMIDKLKEKYPNALIICVTAWNVTTSKNDLNLTTTDYATAMKEVCAARGVVCFDASDVELTGVNMNMPRFRLEYCMTSSDVSHLNGKGHKLVLPAFEKFIAEAYTEFKAAK